MYVFFVILEQETGRRGGEKRATNWKVQNKHEEDRNRKQGINRRLNLQEYPRQKQTGGEIIATVL